jgi:hypothetical protein
MRAFAFFTLMMLAPATGAQITGFSFTVLPSSPPADQPFLIRVTADALSCYTLPDAITISQPSANVVQYELRMFDSCLPLPEQERTYVVPPLPTGAYTLRLAGCVSATPQLPSTLCGTLAEQGVVVAPAPSVIPSLSFWVLSALAGVVGIFGLGFLRRTGG